MANPKRLEARLARLKACVKCLLDPEAEQEKERLMKLHFEMWMFEGSFEDIPEKDRDPELWEFFVRYSPVFLGLIWEGERPGREELLAAEVDFTRAYDDGYDIVGVRPYGAPGPNTPRKL